MGRFSKSLGIRHLVCGSCNGCEHEMNALAGPDYDLTREGWEIVASPRHADAITVTGPMSAAMRDAAAATIAAVAAPCIVVGIGDCAMGKGPFAGAAAVGGGAGAELSAAVYVAGCPPSPEAIKDGLRQAARLLDAADRGRDPNAR
jgi:Ni,Fe-hydrogenase III small subunit